MVGLNLLSVPKISNGNGGKLASGLAIMTFTYRAMELLLLKCHKISSQLLAGYEYGMSIPFSSFNGRTNP